MMIHCRLKTKILNRKRGIVTPLFLCYNQTMIELSKVGVEIDGKIYQVRKINFGVQRHLIELQTKLKKQTSDMAKKYNIKIDEIETSEKVSEDEKLCLVTLSLEIQEVLSPLFINDEDSKILDYFSWDNINEFIEALR